MDELGEVVMPDLTTSEVREGFSDTINRVYDKGERIGILGSPIKRPLSREKTSPAARKSIFSYRVWT